MLITETFHSIQGEGLLTGYPMFFVRTNKCNLRCDWCDSKYTFENGTETAIENLINQCSEAWEKWICFTGGEPLIQREALQFVKVLTTIGKNVLIETGGSIPIKEYAGVAGTVIDMDVKTPSSKEQNSTLPENLNYLRDIDYLKFVIMNRDDYNYAVSFLKKYGFNGNVVFQPAYGIDFSWIPVRMLEDHLNARFMVQLHKLIWGESRGH